MPTPHNPPAAVRRALRKLGADISNDAVGQALGRAALPMHVHLKRTAGANGSG